MIIKLLVPRLTRLAKDKLSGNAGAGGGSGSGRIDEGDEEEED